ncbi:hypothetical protein ACHQM5_029130 [Ranunculus cassubicifolius]
MVPSDQDNSGRWVHKIEENLRGVSDLPLSEEGNWIFKLPDNLRSGNQNAYTPKVVSIGPLHHGKSRLKAMEEHKYRYLKFCLCYNPNITVEDLFNSLNVLEETVRGLYDQEHFHQEFSREEFVTMMLLDGCFIVQLFVFAQADEDTARTYDPKMFTTGSLYKDVESDLKLIENQLPFFLLEHLYQVIFLNDEQRGTHSFFTVAVKYFHSYVKIGGNVILERNGVQVKHLTDILLNCFLPSVTYVAVAPSDSKPFYHLPTATELQKVGVRIKGSENINLLDITFTNGVLAIPKLRLSNSTESTFRNIIAMEQCHPGSNYYVSDYMVVMDDLVNTPEDVGVLISSKVINSYYGNDEDVTQLFNSITRGVTIRNTSSHYYGIIHEVNVYSNRRWPRWKARVRKDYFRSPLTVLSLFGALSILIGTIVGAVFTVLSFTNK